MRADRRSLRLRLAVPAFFTLLLLSFLILTELMISEVTTITVVPGSPAPKIDEEDTLSLWIIPVMLLAAGPIAALVWWWAGNAVRPITELTRLTEEIQAGSLDRRVEPGEAASEIRQLAHSFNRMLERLERASTVQQRLIEDSSHELRTPLAVLSTNVDVTLSDPSPTLSSYRDSMLLTRRKVELMKRIVEESLGQARSDQQTTAQLNNDLGKIAERVLEDHRDMAAAAGVQLLALDLPALLCAAEGTSVERAVSNLLDNAIRHTPSGRRVELSITADDRQAYLSVTDEGPGIDPSDINRIFDRYWYRRSGSTPGSGIGLAIVKQVADAHAGIDVLSPVADGRGVRFTMKFDR